MSRLSWWCSAEGVPWDWAWRPYLGVWLALAALLWVFRTSVRPGGFSGEPRTAGISRWWDMGRGVAVLWAALDWPLGALGAGYLVSAHMVQYILVSLIAPPVLLRAFRGWSAGPGPASAVAGRATRWMGRPAVGIAAFSGIAVLTHLPPVVDGWMVSQLGSFAIDCLWLASGLTLWAPVVRAGPGSARFPGPMQMLYLFGATIPHIGIAAFLVLSPYPLYGIYELAPPTGWMSAIDDQQLAGAIMWIVGPMVVLGHVGGIFFRWSAESGDELGSRTLHGRVAGSRSLSWR